ncbi:hypothetical protein QUH73_01965 [Labilibaculum sp. K2S]|uniref:hypothetical protein n=1 Tax=Labilibaculum sp. K2S TaxID=3056386 RepID=UPI0025A44EDC|nr:hypothetical protein [Labilibaculum sp. K2S]MDM8158573.1 hypothetical protein [Labilibaculum sp. K2S]
MRKLILVFAALVVLLVSCDKEDKPLVITQGDYPVKEYYLERDPKVNVWGAGMDFVHAECQLDETDLDYKYMELEDEFPYDVKFYVVKSYYYDTNGDLKNEGCPAMLLSSETKICKLGEGVDYFNSLTSITEEMTAQLVTDPVIDFEQFKNETAGFYERAPLFAALDQCAIGQKFRSNILVIPEGKTEQEVQPVYLVKTSEGAYVKFMVKEFKPAKPKEKQTLVRWQVVSE